LLVPNPDATRRIAHLIHTQQQHERQWWAGREALVQKLENREEGRKKLNDVLWVLVLSREGEYASLWAKTLGLAHKAQSQS
jgi:hypothetical protein